MGEFFATFNIEGRLLLAQFANFVVVLVLVYYVMLKPLSKLMKSRTETIEKGLDDAKRAETVLMMADHERERIVNDGHQESKLILLEAESKKEIIVESAKVEAEAEAHKMKESAIKEIEILREHQTSEIKKKSVDLILSGIESVLKEKIDSSKNEDLIRGLLK